ncbi:MAG: hypothetical protein Q4P36_04500 [Bowdeniella nasicola]|nr:hypothetical protein [Bowdeniella nasicola]
MRCFIPLRWADLSADAPAAFHAGARAFADTAALRAVYPEADQEEREFVACLAAGDVSALQADEVPRRVVAAADTTGVEPAKADLVCEVVLSEAIGWHDVVALLIDEAAAEDTVRRASRDQAALDALEDYDLLWYDIAERAHLAR